jgi:hypothetical protein
MPGVQGIQGGCRPRGVLYGLCGCDGIRRRSHTRFGLSLEHLIEVGVKHSAQRPGRVRLVPRHLVNAMALAASDLDLLCPDIAELLEPIVYQATASQDDDAHEQLEPAYAASQYLDQRIHGWFPPLMDSICGGLSKHSFGAKQLRFPAELDQLPSHCRFASSGSGGKSFAKPIDFQFLCFDIGQQGLFSGQLGTGPIDGVFEVGGMPAGCGLALLTAHAGPAPAASST